MNIAVVGTGYVGLVTGVTLAEVGHQVTCIDVDRVKVEKMKTGVSPIYEPNLSELMIKNIQARRLTFTTSHEEGFNGAEIIYIAVGTPENEDGSANLTYVEDVATTIALTAKQDTIVVTKSTVPVGTNDRLQQIIDHTKLYHINIEVVSNPEFLKEGSAIFDSFHADRIVIGSNSEQAANVLEEVYKTFNTPIYKTDRRSAEMIKYASNAFLATKISFINEIANICERVGADVEQVAVGMGLDTRIGPQFLKAGIGYGGSCFPKDTKALIQIAGNVEYDFELLKGVVNVNQKQQRKLVDLAYERLGDVKGKKIAILGLTFKPNTDDMREAPSIRIIEELVKSGALVYAYDPVALEHAKKVFDSQVVLTGKMETAIEGAEAVFILTDWDDIKNVDVTIFQMMDYPLILDGRNCFTTNQMEELQYEYYSIGRKAIQPNPQSSLVGG